MENEIKEKLELVRSRIDAAAKAAGQKDVKLIAVSKFQSVEAICAAAAAGARCFGENYVQELCGKIPLVPAGAEWHLIGPLQSNKVKYIAGKGITVQSVDRLSVARALSKYSLQAGRPTPVLLQVNTCGEDTKSGVEPENLQLLFEEAGALEGIQVEGLMTIGPNTADEYAVQRCFEQTKVLFDRLNGQDARFRTLSMGMSHDFEMAIRCGANMVRVGSMIFGQRVKK